MQTERKFIPGDYVLVKQPKRNKSYTQYEPTFYTVTKTKGSQTRARRIYDEREIIRDISQFKLANQLVKEKVGTDIDYSTEKTEMNETRNNIDNYGDYNEIHTNYTPTPETTTTNEGTPNQAEETIIAKDETAIATTTVIDENETTKKQMKQEHVDLEEQKQHQDIYKTISYEHYNGGNQNLLKLVGTL